MADITLSIPDAVLPELMDALVAKAGIERTPAGVRRLLAGYLRGFLDEYKRERVATQTRDATKYGGLAE